jgi:hypothetical protein
MTDKVILTGDPGIAEMLAACDNPVSPDADPAVTVPVRP